MFRIQFRLPYASVLLVIGVLWTVGVGPAASLAQAQLTVPAIPIAAVGKSTRTVSAAEATFHVEQLSAELQANLPIRSTQYPIDSMNAAVAASGTQWLSKIAGTQIEGLQLDPAGQVGASANADSYAKTQIAARLKTPGLSFADKAFTYLSAVRAFTNPYHPERLGTAEVYLKELDLLGNEAAAWQYDARVSLVKAYYTLGRSADIVRHGIRAVELVPIMSFFDRNRSLSLDGQEMYVAVVTALAGQPNGRVQIDKLNATLKAAMPAPPAVRALDSTFALEGEFRAQMLDHSFLTVSAQLGTSAAPIVSNYWLNRATSDSATVVVNDGKIRVVEAGFASCAICIVGLHGLQRIHETFPDVETIMLTAMSGSWGNRLVEPDTEAQYLTDFFLHTSKVTIPIALWKAPKVLNEDGGMTPEDLGPMSKHYPIVSKPTIWIIDGKGTIRQIVVGYSREIERQMVQTIQFLQREATESRAVPASS